MPGGPPDRKRRLVPEGTQDRPREERPPRRDEGHQGRPPSRPDDRGARAPRPYGSGGGRPQRHDRGPPRGGPRRDGHRGPRRDMPFRDPVVETMAPSPIPALARRERELHILSDLPSDPAHGKRPVERTLPELLETGLVLLDKPRGPTSHQVAAWLRDTLGVPKVGHGGTLDPKVSGVLPTTIGDATKAVPALQSAGKEYIAVLRLHGDATEEAIRREARRYIGRVHQTPPLRSAVARRQRARRIYDLEILEIDGREVLFRVACEAGTYIRNLCADLGRALGTRGHMAELRRTRTGVFSEAETVTLHDVKDAVHFWRDNGDEAPLRKLLLPYERILSHLPEIRVRDSAVDALCHGAPLAAPGLAAVEAGIEPGMEVAIFSGKGEAVALATAIMSTEAMLTAKNGNVATLERVLMRTGTYPSGWKKRGTSTTVEKRRVG